MNLSNGEVLLIKRIRKNITQAESAKLYGISRNRYGMMERDEVSLSVYPNTKEVTPLSECETCLLLRRRRGMTQKECAEELGVTRFWFNQMEQGKASIDILLKYWGNK